MERERLPENTKIYLLHVNGWNHIQRQHTLILQKEQLRNNHIQSEIVFIVNNTEY